VKLQTNVESSVVIIRSRNLMPPRLTFLINCFDNSTLFVKCSAVRIRGTHLAHTRFIFKSFPKIWFAVVLEIPHLSATSRTASGTTGLRTEETV
jgi:hypothetical protein